MFPLLPLFVMLLETKIVCLKNGTVLLYNMRISLIYHRNISEIIRMLSYLCKNIDISVFNYVSYQIMKMQIYINNEILYPIFCVNITSTALLEICYT